MPPSNPLDIWPAVMLHGARRAYTLALKAVLQDPAVDAVICIAIAPLPQFSFLDVSESLNEALKAFPATKPVIVWTDGPNPQEVEKRFESQKRIMTYPTLELATYALSLLRDRYRITQRNSTKPS
jgi:acetyltransferase